MMFKKDKKDNLQKESREERFKRVASRRVQEILYRLKLLRNCADRANYSYTDEQVRKIFNTIDEEWRLVKSEFNKHKSKKKEFKL